MGKMERRNIHSELLYIIAKQKNDIIKHFVSVFPKLQTSKSKLFTISVSDLLDINYTHKIEFLMFSGGRKRVHWEQMG